MKSKSTCAEEPPDRLQYLSECFVCGTLSNSAEAYGGASALWVLAPSCVPFTVQKGTQMGTISRAPLVELFVNSSWFPASFKYVGFANF